MTKIVSPTSMMKKIVMFVVSALLMISSFRLVSKADNVVVDDFQNPDLSLISFEGTGDLFRWHSTHDFTQSGTNYTLKSNSWACWSAQDSIDYAYKEVKFNYGKSANLIIETTVTSWNASHGSGSAGIMLRSGLSNDASAVFIGPRRQSIMTVYRFNTGMEFAMGPTVNAAPQYPISLRMVLTGNKVFTYYKYSNMSTWVPMASTVPFQYTPGKLYVGIAAHSGDEGEVAAAAFNGFRVTTDAPEDYVPDPDDSDPGDDGQNKEDPFPEDLPLPETGDILLRETFSDNDMFNKPTSITNPLWKTNILGSEPDIITNPDRSNRYLCLYYADDGYYTAGNRMWTDYSMSMDITFPKDHLPSAENTVKVLVRHQDIPQYGYGDYAVIFTKGNKLQIGSRTYSRTMESAYTILKEITYDYLADDALHSLRIDVIDNVITVYIDNTEKIKAIDTNDAVVKNTTGCVGIGTKGGYALIDNITVRKLSDPVGGDYDNLIGGNFDQPIPKHIQENMKNKLLY